jgi:hypothetical protein
MIDLSHALHDAARTTTAARPTMAAAPVVARIRRRRAARVATNSAVGVAATGAVVVGGWQLAGLRGPDAPPADGLSSETAPTLTCGEPVPDPEPIGGEASLNLEAETTIGATLLVELSLRFEADGTTNAPLSVTEHPQLAVTQGGHVVAFTDAEQRTDRVTLTTGPLPGTETLTGLRRSIDLLSCAPLAGELPVGEYEVYGLQRVALPGSAQGLEGWLRGGPWPLTIGAFPAEEPVVEPTEEPTNPPTDGRPALEDLVISMDGLGPLTFGTLLSEDTSGLVQYDPAYCLGTDRPERWVATYTDPRDPSGTRPAFEPVEFEGYADRINILAPGPHTAEGIGVGSTLSELLAAYPEAEPSQEQVDSLGGPVAAWVLLDGETTMGFEFATSFEGQGDIDPALSPDTSEIIAIALVRGTPYTWAASGGEACG